MEFTGERMLPEKADRDVFWEHIYRYRFAANFVSGRHVLDIACGEGYGSAALLRAGAASVIGVDISPEACEHARRKYRIEARIGDALKIPLETDSVDVVVSFETIEHVPVPATFLDECRRVLRKKGWLIISTPNREAYHYFSPSNPFHCSELSTAEFTHLCEARFANISYYSQRPLSAAWWNPRGIAAVQWSPGKLRGVGRIAKAVRRLLCPHLADEVPAHYREDPIAAMKVRPRVLSSFVDPYAIRPRIAAHMENPTYLLAVAQRA